MDFVLDYIDVTTFWTILLVVHALFAVALLGALTHQAVAVLGPVRSGSAPGFVTRFRSVSPRSYAGVVCVLWLLAFIFGSIIYTKYRIYVRIPIEQQGLYKTLGAFELKEHLVTIGVGLLPIYLYLWHNARNAGYDSSRKWLTIVLAAICWYGFLTGHVLNNVRGFGS